MYGASLTHAGFSEIGQKSKGYPLAKIRDFAIPKTRSNSVKSREIGVSPVKYGEVGGVPVGLGESR